MSQWPSLKAKRVLAALVRIGWRVKRQSGSHKTKAKPNVSAEQLARLRAEDEQLRPMLESEMPAVREEWRQSVRSLTGVVSRHSKEIDEYIQNHGPMTRPEVIERALTKLLSEV